MQALLALRGGEENAHYLGNMHEEDGNTRKQPTGEENMDLWNNQQGREIAEEIKKNYSMNFWSTDAEDLIAEKIMERMRAGKLITNPNDKRRYVPKLDISPNLNPISMAKNAVKASIPQKTTNTLNYLSPNKTPSQNFSDIIRQKFNSKINENNKKLKFRFNKFSGSQTSGNGRWVTMRGRHVFIED